MNRPPRDPHAPLVSRPLVAWGAIQGILALVVVAAVYLLSLRAGMPQEDIRALSFVSLVGANLALILASRTFGSSILMSITRPNASLVWGLGGVATALILVLGWPVARKFFGLGRLHADDLLLCSGLALGLLWVLGLVKSRWHLRLAS